MSPSSSRSAVTVSLVRVRVTVPGPGGVRRPHRVRGGVQRGGRGRGGPGDQAVHQQLGLHPVLLLRPHHPHHHR